MKFVSSGLVTYQNVYVNNTTGFRALPGGPVYLPLYRLPSVGDGIVLELPVSSFSSRRSRYDAHWSDCDHRKLDGTLYPREVFGTVYSMMLDDTVCHYTIEGTVKRIVSRNHLEGAHWQPCKGGYYEADIVHSFENSKYLCVFLGNRRAGSGLYDGWVYAISKTSSACVQWSVRYKSFALLLNEIPKNVLPSGIAVTKHFSADLPQLRGMQSPNILMADLEAVLPVWEDRNVHELANACLTNVRACGVNSIGFLAEIKDILTPFLTIGKAVIHPTPKSLSSAYLGFQYGLANTVRDLQGYADKARQAMEEFSTVHKGSLAHTRSTYTKVHQWDGNGPRKMGYVTCTSTQCYHICYDPIDSAVLNAWRLLDSWGLWPSLSGTWDLVPLSFVLDWFIPLGNIFEANDNMTHLASLRTLFASHSVKHKSVFEAGELPVFHDWQGEMVYTTYTRTVKSRVDYPYCSFSGSDLSTHWVEGSALLVQLL